MRVEAHVARLGKLLADHLFQVSPYQRDYSWTTDQIETLWDDLRRAYESSNEDPTLEPPVHFLGSIVLLHRKNQTRIDVVDGQQRLATFTLLLAAIRNYLASKGDLRAEAAHELIVRTNRLALTTDPVLQMNSHDEEFFGQITRQKWEDVKVDPGRDSHNRLLTGYNWLAKEIHSYFGQHPGEEGRFLQWLAEGAQFVQIDSEDEDSAFTLFECLNDRGLALTTADIIKNFLFSKIGNPLDDAIRQWDEVLDNVGQDATKSFLRHDWITREGYIEEKLVLRRVKQVIQTRDQASEYLACLEDLAPFYAFLVDPSGGEQSKSDFGVAVKAIAGFGTTAYYPLFLALEKNRSAFEERRFGEMMKHLAQFVESHAFRYYVVAGLQSGKLGGAVGVAALRLARAKTVLEANSGLDVLRDLDVEDNVISDAIGRMRVTQKLASYMWGKAEHAQNSKMKAGASMRVVRVMPKKPHASWANISPEVQKEYADVIGNFVLAGGKAKVRENMAFSEKRAYLQKSECSTNKELDSLASWGPQEVRARSAQLGTKARDIWPSTTHLKL